MIPTVFLLLAILSLAAVFGLMFWSIRNTLRERIRLLCPLGFHSVRVLFRLAPDGTRQDVLRCSVFGRHPVTCPKVCLRAPAQS